MTETRVRSCGLGTMGATMAGLEQACEVGAALPVAAMAAHIEAGLVERGHGDDDDSALACAVREWSGL